MIVIIHNDALYQIDHKLTDSIISDHIKQQLLYIKLKDLRIYIFNKNCFFVLKVYLLELIKWGHPNLSVQHLLIFEGKTIGF